jgi:hypothetical protein
MNTHLREVTHKTIGRTGFLKVDASRLKETLADIIEKQKNRLGRFIEKQI